MTEPDGLIRRVAQRLTRLAVQAMPAPRREWAEAMQTELSYVLDDREALLWAAGCFLAAQVERIKAARLMDSPFVRLGAALLILHRAFDAQLPTALTLAYRFGTADVADQLGRATPGDSVQRLAPLMDAMPVWLHVIALVAAVLYLSAAIGLIRYRPSAYALILFALLFDNVANAIGRHVAIDVGVIVNPNPSLLAWFILPIAIPLLVSLTAWSSRPPAVGV